MSQKRGHQRKHLRAPYRNPLLFEQGEFMHKAQGHNISEGGALISHLPLIPSAQSFALMLALPQLPLFKNSSLEELQNFSTELFPAKIVQLRAEIVRKEELNINDLVSNKFFGLKFVEVLDSQQKEIAIYVERMSSNLAYTQVLLDGLNDDPRYLTKLRSIAGLLGLSGQEKVALLRSQLQKDYLNLQW